MPTRMELLNELTLPLSATSSTLIDKGEILILSEWGDPVSIRDASVKLELLRISLFSATNP